MKEEYAPIVLIVSLGIIWLLFSLIAPRLNMSAELGGILFWICVSLLLFFGIYATAKGNVLRKFEETKKIGITTLILGLISVAVSSYLIIIGLFQTIFGSPFGVVGA